MEMWSAATKYLGELGLMQKLCLMKPGQIPIQAMNMLLPHLSEFGLSAGVLCSGAAVLALEQAYAMQRSRPYENSEEEMQPLYESTTSIVSESWGFVFHQGRNLFVL
jgi:hypothetical protein